MKLNKFSKEKFAVYHPSGALGKQLTRVKDIMIKKEMYLSSMKICP